MEEFTQQNRADQEKSELIQDLMSVEKVMGELWKYHKDNPKRTILENEYNSLKHMKLDIELELKNYT
jgi:hypothetical protein